MEKDFIYFNRRAQEEREAAMKAIHPQARRAHLQLANRYMNLANKIEANPMIVVSSAAAL
ncbi:MAG TPA: hypothetical protein VM145_07065 [Sphingomicrobium sp.]|nr:hypothetical protein [Sphingomicrobium sp.]